MIKIHDKFYKELLSLVIPIAIQSFMLALVSVTDAIMLGMIDQSSMAAVSQAGQIQFFLNLLVTGFGIGIGIMTAQYWGKQDISTIEKISPIGLKIIIVISAVVTLAALFFPRELMGLLTNDNGLIPMGADYLKAVAFSYFLCGLTQVYFALMKNTGLTKAVSAISSSAVIINIVFNYLLIFGFMGIPAFGIRGAAYATVIARAMELVLAVGVNIRHGNAQLRWRGILKKADKLLFEDFLRYTMPIIAASLVWGVAFMSYTLIMGHMNADAIAANSLVAIAKNLTSALIRGLGGGAGIIIGNRLGANLLDEAKDYGARLARLSAFTGLGTAILLVLLTPVIMNITSLTEAAQGYLKYMIFFTALNVIAQSINHVVLDGIFDAGGDSKFDMNTNIIFMWCICVPLGLLSAFVFKLPVPIVFCIVNMDEIIKLPVVLRHYKKHIWLRNITREIA